MSALPPDNAPVDLKAVDDIVQRIGTRREHTIAILQALQQHYRYLPPEALRRVCEITGITHIMHVCHGTACHVKSSQQVQEGVERHLKLENGQDTDAARNFTVEKVACVGCCTLAPVVVIDSTTYGHLTPNSVPGMLEDFLATQASRRSDGEPGTASVGGTLSPAASLPEIRIGVGSCCVASGSLKVRAAIEEALRENGMPASVRPVGCVGMCHQTPLVEIVWPDAQGAASGVQSAMASAATADAPAATAPVPPGRSAVYAKVLPEDAAAILQRHFKPHGLAKRVQATCNAWLDRFLADGDGDAPVKYELNVRDGQVCAFLGRQVRIATEYCGSLDPLDLDAYIAHGGFAALRKAITDMGAEGTIALIEGSSLRGRGGAGFPTDVKWTITRASPGHVKYMICNGDEGDPGAFMDRMILESYPYRVLEGMAIAAFCVGAHEGFLYIRAEYPLAVLRVRAAIKRLEERGLLGEKMCDGRFPLKLSVKEGAGAFVCGEETALLASIEGRRGMPRLRPPYPAEKGLWGKPTCVNNVETLAVVPWIIRHGAAAFAALGTEQSKGTKVFALTGKVQRGGLIEVPMGITIRQIVEEIGGGVAPGRTFKAVQIGGPSGGCLPARIADTPVDYEALNAAGAIMGSGGLVVMDDRDCMVDIARYFLKFTQDQSCGQCTFCRVGTRRMLDILDRLCTGHGMAGDMERLEALAREVKQGSLCGLGQTAPNPVLTTLRYFRDEYEAHLEGRCPAGRCAALIKYVVTDKCVGCTLCAQHCPVNAIPFTPYRKHEIDVQKCTRCDICRAACPVQAIEIL
ncbi:MAG: NAD(P)H-dependent oxidoreductase subunit E [Planctomycetota bacterium]|nr:NAD(P)H-dependent oxidoreductase subunit E [Planctomycetota bacterium]